MTSLLEVSIIHNAAKNIIKENDINDIKAELKIFNFSEELLNKLIKDIKNIFDNNEIENKQLFIEMSIKFYFDKQKEINKKR